MSTRLLLAVLFFASCAAPVTTRTDATAARAGAPVVARHWEHESSDLPVDARFHFGQFPNGMRWVWARNGEPKFRSYLRLHVDVGSLAEEDSERGMAHFLEHMAFNGSEHFAADTLVEWFQRHGMGFGADLNASTDFSETIYQLDLPNSDAALLDEGLQVLRDFAFGLTLAREEIEKEKGVIDGEERERDSPGYRVFVRQLQAFFGETRLDDRIPIGVKEVRDRFTAEAVRAFYTKWYRPEHMTLVLVGDLGDLDPVPHFAEFFAGVPPPAAPLAHEPKPGTVTDLSHRLCFHEAEIPSVSITLEKLRPYVDEPFDTEVWRRDTPLDVARSMLNLRFEELVKKESAPFLSAGVGSAEALEVLDGEELSIDCAPDKWREALAACEQELRRALEHGFQPAELDEVRANALRGLREAVEREPTQTSGSLVGEVLHAAENRYVPTSAATDRAILEPLYEALTVEQCQRAFTEAWAKGELSLSVMGNLDLGPETARVLDEALAASRAVAVEKGAAIATAEFAYLPGDDGRAALSQAESARVDDLEFRTLRFPNGVTLSVKRTDFKEQQILLRVVLGEGRLSLAQESLPLGWMVDRCFEDGGLGAHTVDELRRILAGKQVSLSFGTGVDAFTLGGATTKEDLLLECALICAYLRDAGWREDGYVQVKRGLPLMYEGLKHQHAGPVVTDFMSALFDGDERFAFFPEAKLEAVELAAVRDWLAPFLADAPIHVSFVGDLDEDEVVSAVARTFGALPARRALEPYQEHRRAPAPRSGVHQVHAVDTQVPKSLVLIVFPVPDERDTELARKLQFLTEVVRDRLRVEVRERLGASYAPTAGLQQSRTLEGVGMLMLQAMTEPSAAETLKEACLAVTDALARNGVTQEEVDRLREPVLKNLRDARRQNGWWLRVLSDGERRPALLDEVRDEEAFFQSLGPAPLSELAATYLPRERCSSVIVNPAAAAEDASAETKDE